jgi:putative transposase
LCRNEHVNVRSFFSEEHRFWQVRFYDFNVFTDRKRVEKLRYMHRNPVKRGLVASPELWRWSSFRWYAFGKDCGEKLCDWPAALKEIKLRTQKPALRSAKNGAPSGVS